MKRIAIGGLLVLLLLTLIQAGSLVLRPRPLTSDRAIPLLPSFSPTPSPTPSVLASKPPRTTPTPRPRPSAVHKTVYETAWTGPPRRSATCGRSGARVVRFRVQVDRGLPTTPERFMEDVLSILCDERSWIASGRVRFRYDPGGPLLVGLHTDENKDRICYPYTGYGSCQKPGRVVINADRWFGGSRYLPLNVSDYRRLVINHEVGHAIGQRHRGCSKDGAPAPVMMQQSLGLTTEGRTCRANPWPLIYELRTVR